MISKADSLPKRSKQGLQGQVILWAQFNDLTIYIEDEFQENLYFQILKKIFPTIRLEKIFPLGGKKPVLKKAKVSLTNKKKVFIVDKDFDEILDNKEAIQNVFYLERYSIENYLFEQDAIVEIVKEENPQVKTKEIRDKFKITNFVADASHMLAELSAHFLLINKFELGLKFLNIDPNRDCDFKSTPKQIKSNTVNDFYEKVKIELAKKKPRLKYSTQIRLAKRHFKPSKSLINIPGKYLVNLLKFMLRKLFTFVQCSSDSFIYRLFKNCNLNSLSSLKNSIELYAF
ncbi:DUF4435 domain-containing protein [Mucilaginibacter kameinonensis]|uniref:DUF4435 domain-containing protein n=1 Tax=Mucilaginibacter kameinonensis TaxID=452286 RepID=UPI000EF7C077|nr:DUF4435 domain-containing protein [Mucilaginibacter kameinonensis]